MAKTPPRYINRELSWLEFNQRVLDEAGDSSIPLLERLKFLTIFSSNLEEFFMVRVGGLQQKLQASINVSNAADRIPPRELVQRINLLVQELTAQQYHLLNNEIFPPLAKAGIQLIPLDELTAEDRTYLRQLFNKQILPVLTPLAIDPGHPFPYISNLSRNFAAGGAPNLKRIIDLVRLIAAAELAKNPGYDVRDVSKVLAFASSSHLAVTAQRVIGTKPASLSRLRAIDLIDRFTHGRTRSRARIRPE